MIVIVSINNVQIVVPCYDGKIKIYDLMKNAAYRYNCLEMNKDKHKVVISKLFTEKENAMLFPSDMVCDVCRDREILYCDIPKQQHEPNCGADKTIRTEALMKNTELEPTQPTFRASSYPDFDEYIDSTPSNNFSIVDMNSANSVFSTLSSKIKASVDKASMVDETCEFYEIHLRKNREKILGLSLIYQEPPSPSQQGQIFVKDVLENSPASIDGRIQVGDKIITINQTQVDSWNLNDVCKLIGSYPKDLISIGISRSKKNQSCDSTWKNFYVKKYSDLTKFFLRLPVGGSLDDLGILFSVGCGLKEHSSKPVTYVSIHSILKTGLFNLMFKECSLTGFRVQSIMQVELEDVSENYIISHLKLSFEKCMDEKLFEMVISTIDSDFYENVFIYEGCAPSFFMPIENPTTDEESSFSSLSLNGFLLNKEQPFLLPSFAEWNGSRMPAYSGQASSEQTINCDNDVKEVVNYNSNENKPPVYGEESMIASSDKSQTDKVAQTQSPLIVDKCTVSKADSDVKSARGKSKSKKSIKNILFSCR